MLPFSGTPPPPDGVRVLCSQTLVLEVWSPGEKDPNINDTFDHENNSIEGSSGALEKSLEGISDRYVENQPSNERIVWQ